jgi:hypothetical protein
MEQLDVGVAAPNFDSVEGAISCHAGYKVTEMLVVGVPLV